jgi:hypothetical protein
MDAPCDVVSRVLYAYSFTSSCLQEALKYGYILVATNWVGLAQGDAPGVAAMLGSNLTNFAMIPDRCTQGMVNALAVMAVLHKPDFADDPAFHFPGRTTSVLDAV